MVDPMEGLIRAVEVFDRLGIPYYVGGSIASSEHGIKRTTLDADVVADMASIRSRNLLQSFVTDSILTTT